MVCNLLEVYHEECSMLAVEETVSEDMALSKAEREWIEGIEKLVKKEDKITSRLKYIPATIFVGMLAIIATVWHAGNARFMPDAEFRGQAKEKLAQIDQRFNDVDDKLGKLDQKVDRLIHAIAGQQLNFAASNPTVH
jgi:hypothetical protein